MTTFQIKDNDIVITKGTPVLVTDNNALIAHLTNVVRLWLADWQASPETGIDWLNILGEAITEKRIASIVRNRIIADGNINNVSNITASLDRTNRKAEITMTVSNQTVSVEV